MIGIIEYGIGNIGSILNMFKKLGIEAMFVKYEEDIARCDKLMLPGVGSFDIAMTRLLSSGLIPSIMKHTIDNKKHLLGICLGMQMLGKSSEEGLMPGLGLIDMKTVKFTGKIPSNLKIPHMGWDLINIVNPDDPLVNDIIRQPRYYFAHSYYVENDQQNEILMTCEYGITFTIAVRHENIIGFQFHPEKSHIFGMELFKNFAGLK
jgi:imidazole glycerol-phosphate synthase subunit HisH